MHTKEITNYFREKKKHRITQSYSISYQKRGTDRKQTSRGFKACADACACNRTPHITRTEPTRSVRYFLKVTFCTKHLYFFYIHQKGKHEDQRNLSYVRVLYRLKWFSYLRTLENVFKNSCLIKICSFSSGLRIYVIICRILENS